MSRSDDRAGFGSNGKPVWNLITAMADDAIDYINTQTATNPKRPWFIHYAPGATHAPPSNQGMGGQDQRHASV
jgi:arylsulfatase